MKYGLHIIIQYTPYVCVSKPTRTRKESVQVSLLELSRPQDPLRRDCQCHVHVGDREYTPVLELDVPSAP